MLLNVYNLITCQLCVGEWQSKAWGHAEPSLIKTEVAEQSSAIALSRSPSSSPRPSLQSQEHNVQSLNSSRLWLHGSLPLYTLAQCKHLIKIAWAATIATKCNSRTASLWSPHCKSCVSQSWGKWQAQIGWLCCCLISHQEAIMDPQFNRIDITQLMKLKMQFCLIIFSIWLRLLKWWTKGSGSSSGRGCGLQLQRWNAGLWCPPLSHTHLLLHNCSTAQYIVYTLYQTIKQKCLLILWLV